MAGAVAGGGALLLASLQCLFVQMASRDVLTFLRGQKISDNLLKKLKMKLLAVKGVLSDAEAQQIADSDVNDWMDEVKDAVHDAEDVFDGIATEALRCRIESDSTRSDQVRNFIESRVEQITETLEYLAEQKDVLGLKQGVVGEILSKRRMRSSLVDVSGVFGRQEDINEIVHLLSSSSSDITGSSGKNNKISVIALVGMGGIGKTTLAQMIYKDRRVVDCFDLKAWVCVSEEFDLLRITKTILQGIASDNSFDDSDLNLLQCKLEESLNRKKFLLVLDDVWNESYHDFENLLLPFNACRPGSKIIVTTRSGEVTRVTRSIRIHHLGELPFEDCWSLFVEHAFENGDSSPHPKLEEIGKEIVKKCKGLPLAAKTLGAALYSELRVKQWENVLNSRTWDLPNDEILPALRLSYSYLPPQVKRCFSYCSIFPKDYEFEKEKLIMLWMAEGFLQEPDNIKTMEEVGDGYFCDLVSRSFFLKSRNHKSYFVMHDLIQDLAQLVSGKFCAQLKDHKMNGMPRQLRHLSYFRSQYDRFERFETMNEVSGLRTFLPLDLRILHQFDKVSEENRSPNVRIFKPVMSRLSNEVLRELLLKFKYLRVLSLSYYMISSLPDLIGDLKQLRYLDFTHTPIKRLPDSICILYNLQTLVCYRCWLLRKLPEMVGKMTSLRHLDIRHSGVKEMPSQIGQLRVLQKLSNYVVGEQSGSSVRELRELSSIGGSLVIQKLQNVVDAKDALEADLAGKQYLDELELEWDSDDQNGAEMVVNKLHPHSNLKRLTIHRYGGSRFPYWLGGGGPGSLVNMVSLRLWRCENVSAFPPLGQLPSLKHLYVAELSGIERVGVEFYGNGPSFVSLKAMSFQGMSKWKEWLCLEGQGGGELFPRLKELYIQNCPMLTGDLPVHLPVLTTLRIEGCEQLVAPLPSVPSIRSLSTRCRDISEWKEVPPFLQYFSITNSDSFSIPHSVCLESLLDITDPHYFSISHSDCLESLVEEGILQRNTILEQLTISYCSFSRPLYRVCLPLTLTLLKLKKCKRLEFLLPGFFKCYLPSLRVLDINDGTVDSSLSIPLGNFPGFRDLSIDKLNGLEFLSVSISDEGLSSMNSLHIYRCHNLVSVCFEEMKATCLQSLEFIDCPELVSPIRGLPSGLTSLRITQCDKFASQMDFGVQALPSLTHLVISDLPNLSSLDDMGLHLLGSLRQLVISNCPKLQSLTDERLPTSLTSIRISYCPLLGEYWSRMGYGSRLPVQVVYQ